MPYLEKQIERLYFNIGEVAKALQILPSKLRFYDEQFELGIHRSRKGDRKITVDQIGNLALIVRLTEHLHIKTAKKVFYEGRALSEEGRMLRMSKEDRLAYDRNRRKRVRPSRQNNAFDYKKRNKKLRTAKRSRRINRKP